MRAFSPAQPPSNRTAVIMGGDSVQPYVAYKTLLVAVGDSITAGQTGVPGYPNTAGVTYHELYATNNETGLLVAENRAVGGSGLSSAAAGAAALDARIAANSGNDIYCLVVAWGRNDGNITDASYNGGASWIDQMKAYLTDRRAAGWNKIIVCTVTPYDVETDITTRENGNDLIRGLVGTGHADGVCDYGNPETSLMGNVSAHTGDTYYQDYVHPTVRGHYEMYKVFTPVANSVLTLATKTATPVISPLGASYTGDRTVSISCETEGAAIYYTLDGSTPDNTKTLYTVPFTQASGTVKTIAIKGGLTDSSINSQTFTVVSGMYWNSADISTYMTLSADKKTALQATAATGYVVRTNTPIPSGKYCIEVIIVGSRASASYGGLGFLETTEPLTNNANLASIPNKFREYTHGAMVASGATAFGYSGGWWNNTFTDGERMLFAIDTVNGKCWHSKTGANWALGGVLTSSNPVTGVQPHWTFTGSANWHFFVEPYSYDNNPDWRLPPAAEVTGIIPSGYTLLNA